MPMHPLKWRWSLVRKNLLGGMPHSSKWEKKECRKLSAGGEKQISRFILTFINRDFTFLIWNFPIVLQNHHHCPCAQKVTCVLPQRPPPHNAHPYHHEVLWEADPEKAEECPPPTTHSDIFLQGDYREPPGKLHHRLSWKLHPTGLQEPATTRCIHKASSIVENPTHPSHRIYSPPPCGRMYCSLRSVTTRLQNSFFPQAIRLNAQGLNWSPLLPFCMLSCIAFLYLTEALLHLMEIITIIIHSPFIKYFCTILSSYM